MASKARYDAVADWYPSWVGDGGGLIAEAVGDLLPPTLRGSRVLDVACGHGRASRALARLGAVVVGVDISARLVASARAAEAAGVRIRVGPSHRTLSTYVNALIDAGFSLELAVEPPAPVPTFLLLRCRCDYQSWSV
jgi:SAM-dependent methyltransferase